METIEDGAALLEDDEVVEDAIVEDGKMKVRKQTEMNGSFFEFLLAKMIGIRLKRGGL